MKNSILGKARWLREVALATSKNNGARVAREWLKYAAMFVMLFTIGVGNMWGATPTLSDLSFSTESSVRIVNDNFNGLSTSDKTAKMAANADLSGFGAFNKGYNNSTSNHYAIESSTFGSNGVKITMGSGSPCGIAISGKTFETKGAWRITTTKASKMYVGFYAEGATSTAYAKAKASVYIQNNAGAISISQNTKSGNWQSVGSSSNTKIDICVIYNNTTSKATYGDNIALAAKTAHVYIDGTCIMNGANPKAFTISELSLSSFRVYPIAKSGNVAAVDDVQIWNALPEAAEKSTPLGTINGSVSMSSTSATLTWDDIANVNSWAVACKNTSTSAAAGSVGSITTNGAGKKTCTITGLICGGTGYTFTISATAASGYCDNSWELTGSTTACTDPAITVSPASLTGLDYIVGSGPSAAQNITLGGSYLTGNLTVSAPANFEVSIDGGSSYGNSKTVTVTSGSPTVSTIKVRLKPGLAVGNYGSASTYVTVSGGGATTQNVSVQGSVLKPTITASPTSIAGWSTQVGTPPATTKTVTVTGVNLKEAISANLVGGNASDFSVTPNSISQSSGSASGTVTISYKGDYSVAATKTTTLRLSSSDATSVDVGIEFAIVEDPREKFELLTSSNLSQLSDGAKIVLVYPGVLSNYAAKSGYISSNGYDEVEEGATEFEISGTTLYAEEGNHLLVLTVGETTGGFSLHDGNKYLANTSSNKIANSDSEVAWTIGVDGEGYALITCTADQKQTIKYNASVASAYFRAYSSGQQSIYAYFQPSVHPSITLRPTSLSGFTYVVGNGPSATQVITINGINLTSNLTITAPSGYEVSTSSASDGFGSSATMGKGTGSIVNQKIWVRLTEGLSRDEYSGNVSVTGGGTIGSKTVAVSGNVTNAFHTVTISAGANGSVSPSGAQSVEEGQTLEVTATPNTGYSFRSWTVNGSGSSCVGSTFTMGTADATLQANFAQIMVSGITVSGNATVKTLASTTYTATVSPAEAFDKTVSWSVINGTGTATINSSTGELTAGSPGTVTIRATATDGSNVYGELSVTIQDVVRYKFVKMTSTPSPWEDDEYLIVHENNSTSGSILKASDPFGSSDPSTGVGATKSVTITSSTITLEDDKDDAVHISYVDTKGYLVQAVGGYRQYILQNGTTTGSSSMKTLASDNTTNTRYWSSIAHNLLKYQSTYNIAYNSNSFRFYSNNYTSSVVLYRLERSYTVTRNNPSNGTLTSDMSNAASGTTVTLTVTPSGGYELNTLTITTDGGGTVTPTKVDETHYTFTMPKDNVTVEATFKTEVAHTLHFNVPSCVTPPVDITGKTTGSIVTMPSEPAGTPDGYTFVGWALAAQESPVAVQPTTIAPGSYKVPSGEVTLQYYALYSEGGISVGTGTFNYTKEASSGLTALVQLTSDAQYILSSVGNKDNILSNTINGTRVGYSSCTGANTSNATISTAEGVYLLQKTSSYYTLKNVATGQYLASTGRPSQATMMNDDGTDDHVKWSIVSTAAGYKLANKYNTDNSVDAYLGFSSGNGYGCYASSNGSTNIYFYKAASGAVTSNVTYTTLPACFCEYRLLKSTDSGSNWEEVGCFTKVKPSDASDHEWRLSNFTMPAHNSSTLLKVQKDGADLIDQTVAWQSGRIPLAELQGGSCPYKAFELEGAVGTLRIFDVEGGNSVDANSNFYLGFYPTYQIYHKNAAPDVWISEEFELVSSNTYQTAITTAPASYFADNYQYYVGVRKSDGTTKFAEKNSNEATAKSNTVNMKTMSGMTSDVGGRSGVYQIYSNSCNQNWNCTFIPYYVVYYHDVNGKEIEEWRDVLTSPTTTVHDYASGQTGWATSLGGGANATYNTGASITPAADVHLYQVAPTYTVTYSVASETSAYNGTSVKVIQGQSVTLPTITFSCGLYDTHVGWVTGSDIPELEPAAKIDEPSTLVGAPGASYTPTADVTLKALYGYECDGNAGWQKQTTISAGRYVIAASTYGFAGLENAVTSSVNQGSYVSDITITDDVIHSTAGMHEVEVILGANSTFAIKYQDGYYMENNGGYFNGNITSLANAYRWQMNALGRIYDASETTMFLQINNSNYKFKCYKGSQSNYAHLYKYIKTGYYTTNPTCDIPTKLTVTFNANSPTGDAGDVSNMPTTIVRAFSSYPTLSSAINFNSNPTPTCDGYTIQKWNTAANGSGTDYALDATISTYSGSSLPLYAIWDRTFTVTFDNQGTQTPVTQASAGASVAVPSATSPCNGEWAFVGWSETAIAPKSLLPTLEITAGEGTYTPTADKTLYAIYQKTSESSPFVAGMSGAYKITNGSTVYAGEYYSNRLPETDAAGANVFYIKYTSADGGKYTIQQANGKYVANSGSATDITLSDDPCYWSISKNANLWSVQLTGGTRYLRYSAGTGFKAYNINTTSNTLAFVAAEGQYYYRTMSCAADFDITFHNNGTTINWADGYLEGSYKNIASGSTVSTFPTATFEDWTFLGWRTASYTESTGAPESSGIYSTGGNALTVASDENLYPVFTKFADNEPFDEVNGGDYYIYYIESGSNDGYGNEKRVYAATYSGSSYNSTAICSGASEFTFTKLANGNWTIYDKTKSKYLKSERGNDIAHSATASGAEWRIAKNGAVYDVEAVGNPDYQMSASVTEGHATFKNYSKSNLGGGIYHRISIGGCTNRTFTSSPSNAATISIHGEARITSRASKAVKANTVLSVTASNIGTANLTVSSNNSHFTVSPTSIPVTNRMAGPVSIYVTYTPAADALTDGIESAIITVSDGAGTPTTASTSAGDVQGRHLPTDFVIAAKIGNNWYALPADCSTSTSSTAGVLIDVDDTNDPTRATGAPMNTKYGLQPVRPGRVGDYGSRLVFTEHLSTATTEDQKTLYNGETTSIQVNAMYKYYADPNPNQYEWIPTTTDLKDYTLTSAKTFDGDAAARTVSLNTSGVFGTLLQAKAYNGKVRLLPATFYEPAEVQILKWKTNSVIVMYTGTDNATTKVGSNPASDPQALNSHKLTQGIYEFTTNEALTANAGQTLRITLGSSRLEVEIPLIITGNTTAAADGKDVVILDGAKFTAAATKYNYRNVYVYGGGKLDIPTNTSLGVNNIILRAGGVTTNGSGGNATYAYVYPQVKLVGTLTSTQTNIKYEYVTDYDHWYHLCLPFNATLTSIHYPQEYYGSNVTAENRGSWVIKRYDGATRATGNYDAWKDIEKDSPAKTEVTAGHGYIFWGAPKKVTIGGDRQRQAWGIQRMTMAITAGDAKTAENADKNVTGLAAHSSQAGGVNDQGWNLIGNPYMANLTGLESTSLKQGQLVKQIVGGQWTGKWIISEENTTTRYITVPNNNFETYEAVAVAGSGMTLTAGKAFFVQLDGVANAVQFETSKRASLAPAWYRNAEAEQPVDVETGIVMSSETLADEMNFWIKDGKTEAYEFNADYPKTPNKTNFNIYGVHQSGNLSWVAISPAIAEGDMAIGYQVPAAGDYTLSLSEKYIAEEIESVFVTDHGVSPELTTDLMVNTYSFTVHQAETNNERFTVSIKVREKDNTATDIGNSTVDTHAVKFIRDDKMYILRNGLLYDATGKRVTEINK